LLLKKKHSHALGRLSTSIILAIKRLGQQLPQQPSTPQTASIPITKSSPPIPVTQQLIRINHISKFLTKIKGSYEYTYKFNYWVCSH
jgi:hypothetical protein